MKVQLGDKNLFQILSAYYEDGRHQIVSAMEIIELGCVLKVRSDNASSCRENLIFIPDSKIVDDTDNPPGKKLVRDSVYNDV